MYYMQSLYASSLASAATGGMSACTHCTALFTCCSVVLLQLEVTMYQSVYKCVCSVEYRSAVSLGGYVVHGEVGQWEVALASYR